MPNLIFWTLNLGVWKSTQSILSKKSLRFLILSFSSWSDSRRVVRYIGIFYAAIFIDSVFGKVLVIPSHQLIQAFYLMYLTINCCLVSLKLQTLLCFLWPFSTVSEVEKRQNSKSKLVEALTIFERLIHVPKIHKLFEKMMPEISQWGVDKWNFTPSLHIHVGRKRPPINQVWIFGLRDASTFSGCLVIF